jgi:hypothetical protein
VDLLLEAVRAIEDEHKSVELRLMSEKKKKKKKKNKADEDDDASISAKDDAPLGADDIFPVFVYVLVQVL